MTNVDWHTGIWTNNPLSSRVTPEGFEVEAAEGSDYWQQTLYGFQHDNGHALLVPWVEGQAMEVGFSLQGFSGLYDQAGIMLWHGPETWIKAGIEMNDGLPHAAVVVTDQYSDWSLSPVPEWSGKQVTFRASCLEDAVIIRARAGGEAWRTLRVARFAEGAGLQAGPLASAPTRSGFRVTFTRWAFTAPDTGIHAEPPADPAE